MSLFPTLTAVDDMPAREGLPPCLDVVVFDGRAATRVDSTKCPNNHTLMAHGPILRWLITSGSIDKVVVSSGGYPVPWVFVESQVDTADEAEAEAAWEAARHYVLTGELTAVPA